MKAVVAATIGVCLGLTMTNVAIAQNMSGAELKDSFSGKSMTFSGKSGKGTSVYNADGSASIVFKGKPSNGKWRVKGSSICTAWENIRDGKEGCFTVQALGGNKFQTSTGFTVTTK
jgi:hypothetical protein